jgi:ABC-type Fe3+-hydroxamate transport system substrate-binding protein
VSSVTLLDQIFYLEGQFFRMLIPPEHDIFIPLRSPCIGVCKISVPEHLCTGCLRSVDEISDWRDMSLGESDKIWGDLERRREVFDKPSYVRDQLKRTFPHPGIVNTIVSLVPSLTQTLYDLGLGEKVLGITRFCPKYEGHLAGQCFVGGTKNINLMKIQDLNPDIIFANKEENPREEVEALSERFPVWVSDVSSLNESLHMLQRIGELLNCSEKSHALLQDIRKSYSFIHQTKKKKSCIYCIWKTPYMLAGGGTYIDACLEWLGFDNLLKNEQRYPELSVSDFQEMNPEYIFLPDEPYAFKEVDLLEVQKLFPQARVVLVKGKYFSWYGSLMLEAADYFKEEMFLGVD